MYSTAANDPGSGVFHFLLQAMHRMSNSQLESRDANVGKILRQYRHLEPEPNKKPRKIKAVFLFKILTYYE